MRSASPKHKTSPYTYYSCMMFPSVETLPDSTSGASLSSASSLPTTSNVVVLNGHLRYESDIPNVVTVWTIEPTPSDPTKISLLTVLEFQKICQMITNILLNVTTTLSFVNESGAHSLMHDPSSYETWTGPFRCDIMSCLQLWKSGRIVEKLVVKAVFIIKIRIAWRSFQHNLLNASCSFNVGSGYVGP